MKGSPWHGSSLSTGTLSDTAPMEREEPKDGDGRRCLGGDALLTRALVGEFVAQRLRPGAEARRPGLARFDSVIVQESSGS